MVIIQATNKTIIISKADNLIRFNTETQINEVVKIPEPTLKSNFTKSQIEVINKEERIINCIITSKNNNYIAVSTENKQVVVYNSNLIVIKNILVPRVASKLYFTPNQDILVADKTGDVFLYKLNSDEEPILLLGHLSIILDITLSDCGKYIVTCDRDEKIRVSHFPNAYNIVSYCLGHKEFVTNIKICGKLLISASGDGTIRFWDFIKGQQLALINTNEYITEGDILIQFSKEMDAEKVDVVALPVTDMQIYLGDDLIIATSLHNYAAIQIFKVDLSTFKSVLLNTIETVNNAVKFYLTNCLYILNNSSMTLYELVEGTYVTKTCASLEKFNIENKKYLEIIDNNIITVLYKRKFDNVQEYLERKKVRLELKQ